MKLTTTLLLMSLLMLLPPSAAMSDGISSSVVDAIVREDGRIRIHRGV
jgi:hypothetical protein